MANYTFKERASIYTTVEADSIEEAWEKLDAIKIEVPKEVDIDIFECELIDTEEEDDDRC
jgi:hypothetical protein